MVVWMDVTCYCSVHYASVFQLNGHRLVIQLHQESVECDFIRGLREGRMGWTYRTSFILSALR